MNEEEAKILINMILEEATSDEHAVSYVTGCQAEELKIAIECMEEVEQYRALGTVEELKEAREKQIPKKPNIKPTTKEVPTTHNLGRLLEICCPVCGKRIFAIYETDLKRGGGVTREAKGCPRCLQAIDFTGYYCTPKLDKSDEDIEWSEEDD